MPWAEDEFEFPMLKSSWSLKLVWFYYRNLLRIVSQKYCYHSAKYKLNIFLQNSILPIWATFKTTTIFQETFLESLLFAQYVSNSLEPSKQTDSVPNVLSNSNLDIMIIRDKANSSKKEEPIKEETIIKPIEKEIIIEKAPEEIKVEEKVEQPKKEAVLIKNLYDTLAFSK